MEPKTIKIDEVEYVRKSDTSSRPATMGNICIDILQRRWVMVGDISGKGIECLLENANLIRHYRDGDNDGY